MVWGLGFRVIHHGGQCVARGLCLKGEESRMARGGGGVIYGSLLGPFFLRVPCYIGGQKGTLI